MATNLTERLLSDVYVAYQNEYKDLSDTWRQIDSKAQGTLAVCGIILAGTLAFIRALTDSMDGVIRYLLGLTSVAIIVSVLLSLLVLRVKAVAAAPFGQGAKTDLDNLLSSGNPIDQEDVVGYYNEQIERWQITIDAVAKVNSSKAAMLLWAQVLLVLGVLLAGATIIRIAWGAG